MAITRVMDKLDAIRSLYDRSSYHKANSAGVIVWKDGHETTSKEISDIDAEVIRLQTEYDAQVYARNRQADYPNWGDQLNKIYDDGITKWKSEMVDPVKAKWPKDNSGPK